MSIYARSVVVVALLASLSLAADVVVSSGTVVPGEWNSDFSAVLAVANRDHRPLLLVYVSQGCPHCSRLKQAIDGEAFSRWQKDRKLLMAYVQTNGHDARYFQVRNLIKSAADELPEYPWVYVHWPRVDGVTNRVAFAGRRGEMGTDRQELLSVEFMMTIDRILKDYLVLDPTHLDIGQIVSNSTKKISCARIGTGGSVVMTPETGVLPEGGKVLLEARAAADSLFVGWFDPHGNNVGWDYRLTVSGRMPAGPYTAKFRSKTGCPPPAFTTAATSLCTRVGQKFEYAIPVNDECRPVRFRSAQRLPRGLRLDKTTGELSGFLRTSGTMRINVIAIGSDEAHTTKSHEITLDVRPKEKSIVKLPDAMPVEK